MKLAVMQPYVFPYLGYFQLVQAADCFVFFDDVNFIKRGWIHRNGILANGDRYRFTIPLQQASQHKRINETIVHPQLYPDWRKKFMKTLRQEYQAAPQFEQVYELIGQVLAGPCSSIAELASSSVLAAAQYLNISTKFVHSSSLNYSREVPGKEKIISICQQQEASTYINLIGGTSLYEPASFEQHNLQLRFIQSKDIVYSQFREKFVPNLSIIDVMMFNDPTAVQSMLQQYQLIE